MKRVFEQYAHQELEFKGYTAYVAGFNDRNIILATREEPIAKFKKLDKTAFVAEEYRNEVFNYIYSDEKTLLKNAKNNQEGTSN